jgi:serine/threonine protein kinase
MATGEEFRPRSSMPGVGGVLGDRYELGEIIGRGGMATVYHSTDHRMGRAVAVKVFHPGVELADADQRYRREVILLSGLRHPGLVSVFDADLDAAVPYLVTELVEGPTLSQRIRVAPLSEHQVARLGAALCRTLAYVHGHGIVHRDVKPANILLAAPDDDPLGLPKLVDFGIAIVAEATRLTSVDVTLGTPSYVSPEQLRGGPVTPATDIYSLGLVLLEALTGQVAYPGTGIEAAVAHLSRAPAIPPDASPGMRAVLAELTASEADARPAAEQAAQCLDELTSTDLAQSLTTQVVPLTEGPRHTAVLVTGRRGRARAIVAAMILAAIAGIAAIVSFTSQTSSGPGGPSSPRQAAPSSGSSSTPHQTRTTAPVSVTTPGAPAPAVPPSSPASATSRSRATSSSATAPGGPASTRPSTSAIPTTPPPDSTGPASSSPPGSSSGPPPTSPATSPPPIS